MYIIEVSPETIIEVLQWYGESLSDLPAQRNYEDDFEEYVKARLPARYAQWKAMPYSYSALFDWSNNLLGHLITEEEHDRILADFCNQNVVANKHIQGLLDDMK